MATSFTYSGQIIQYTVTTTGVYSIAAYGAQGGSSGYSTGGLGAEIVGDFTLTTGEVLDILVGGQGATYRSAGGGGGTFVIAAPAGGTGSGTKLVIAGGGGGSYAGYYGGNALTGTSGGQGGGLVGFPGGSGGTSGGGGGAYRFGNGGGGGYTGNGAGYHFGGGSSFTNGGAGGYGGLYGKGGFGGGGGRNIFGVGGGGGGGYSGGGGGYDRSGGGGGSYDGGTNQVLVAGENSGNGLVVLTLLCFLRGTHILTPTGAVCVEDLRIGDRVVTRFGGIQPVKWIGRQTFQSRFVEGNRDHIPVCIRAGALGESLPARDLYISPGHSMLVDGQLVLARNLVNGVTITQDWAPSEIAYYQIELERHDCVIAEGAWSETYADGPGLRDQFHNADEFAELYPNQPPAAELMLCAPRPERGARLDAALRPVVARAAEALKPGPLRGSIDLVEAPWTINGWAQDALHPELPVLLEVLIDGKIVGTTLACDYRADLEAAKIGAGRCAFFLTSPVRLRPEMLTTVEIRRASDHAALRMSDDCAERLSMPAAEVPSALRLVG
jgi:hypothetical protein